MKALLINLSRMGDLVQMTTAAKGLKAQHGAEVSVLVYADLAAFARGLAGVDHVVPFHDEVLVSVLRNQAEVSVSQSFRVWEQMIEAVNSTDYDLVCNLTHNDFSALLMRSITGKKKLGHIADKRGMQHVSGSWMRYFFAAVSSRKLNPFNLADIHRRACGVTQSAGTVEYDLGRVDRDAQIRAQQLLQGLPRPIVAIQPGANVEQRRWPAEYFGELAARLAQQGIAPVILGGPKEKELADKVVGFAGENLLNLAGATDLFTFSGLLKEVDLLIANDSGPSHLATASGTPVVSISLAMVRPEDTSPLAPGQFVLETLHPNHPCPETNPCPVCDCGREVPVDAVLETSLAVLERREPDLNRIISLPGKFRLRKTDVDEWGDQVVQTLFTSKEVQPPTFDDRAFRVFWHAILDENTAVQVIPASGLTLSERETAIKTAMLLDELARLFRQENDQPLGELIRETEKLLTGIEQGSERLQGVLLTCRLEREELYACGRGALLNEGVKRFETWSQGLNSLAGRNAAEVAA